MNSMKTNKKMDSKTLGLILLVPVLLFLGYFLFLSGDGQDESVKSEKVSNEIPLPDSKDEDVTKSKVQIYEEEKERLQKERVEERRTNTSEEDFYNQAVTDLKENKDDVFEGKKKTIVGEENTRKVKYVPTGEVIDKKKETVVKEEVKKVEEVVIEEKKNINDPGGFGIVRANSGNNVGKMDKSVGNKEEEKEFYIVMLEEDTKIKNQSSVVFYLIEDCYIDGIFLEKNSILFGKAEDRGGVFDIKIKQVKTRGGKTISLDNVYVFDEKFSKGLAYEGTINESIKEGTNQTAGELTGSVATSVASSTGLGLAVNAVDNTIKAMTRKGESSISLSKGYKVYIKKEKV